MRYIVVTLLLMGCAEPLFTPARTCRWVHAPGRYSMVYLEDPTQRCEEVLPQLDCARSLLIDRQLVWPTVDDGLEAVEFWVSSSDSVSEHEGRSVLGSYHRAERRIRLGRDLTSAFHEMYHMWEDQVGTPNEASVEHHAWKAVPLLLTTDLRYRAERCN